MCQPFSKQAVFVTYLTKGVVASPINFLWKGSYDAVFGRGVPACYPYQTKMSMYNFYAMSLWRNISQNGKNRKNGQNFFLAIEILGTFDFQRVCGKSLSEWIGKHNKKGLGLKKKRKKNCWDIGWTAPTPLYTHFFLTTTLPGGGWWVFCCCCYNERKEFENNKKQNNIPKSL